MYCMLWRGVPDAENNQQERMSNARLILDNKRNIWFGAFDGVYRYDGKDVTEL